MSIKEQLLFDMKEALKSKDVIKKDTIQIVRAGVLQIEKDEQKELTEAEVLQVITKEVKKRIDVLPDYEKNNRMDKIETINKQLEILRGYLPKQLTKEELTEIVNETIKECNATSMKDMGAVMNVLKEKTTGKADNKLVSQIVRECLK